MEQEELAENAVGENHEGGHTREGTEQQRTAGGADKEAEKAEGNRTGAGASLQESRRFIGNCAQPLRISENPPDKKMKKHWASAFGNHRDSLEIALQPLSIHGDY